MRPVLIAVGLCLTAVAAAQPRPASPGTGKDGRWLADPEQEFFDMMSGSEVKVGAKPAYVRIARPDLMADLSARSPEPVKSAAASVALATASLRKVTPKSPTPAELEQAGLDFFFRTELAVMKYVGGKNAEVAEAAERVLFSKNGKDDGRGRASKMWTDEANQLAVALGVGTVNEAASGLVTTGLEKRLRPHPAPDLALSARFAPPDPKKGGFQATFRVAVRAGKAAADRPLVRVTVHRRPDDLLTEAAESAAIALAIGTERADPGRSKAYVLLAYFREKAANRPLVYTELLPTLAAGETATVGWALRPRDVSRIDRVEARVWTADGWFAVESVPGSAEARQAAARYLASRPNP